MLKSDSLKALAPALLKAQQSMGAALKDSKNPFFKSKYADLNAVIDATVPTLNDAGIVVLQTPNVMLTADGSVKPVIQTILLHESGEFIASNTEIVAAKANDPQSSGSAISYARRYGLQATITLKAEDDDAEGAMGRGKVSLKEEKTNSGSITSKIGETSGVVGVSNQGPATDATAVSTIPPKKSGYKKVTQTSAPVASGDDI